MRKTFATLLATLATTAHVTGADAPAPPPSGPQTDGSFRKVILDSDQQVDGKWTDTLVDPMEISIAADGRVFLAERQGIIKVWKPDTKTTTVIGKVDVFA